MADNDRTAEVRSALGELSEPFDRLTDEDARWLLRDAYGIRVHRIERLPSETDDSFRVDTDGEGGDTRRVILKLAHPADDPTVIDMQTAAMTWAAAADPGLPLQKVQPALDGSPSVHVGGRVARVISYLSGSMLDAAKTSRDEQQKLGATLARLAIALRDFEHPGAHRVVTWDLQHLTQLVELLPHIRDDVDRERLSEALGLVIEHTLPGLPSSRRQFIHNDFNPGNIVADPARAEFVTGILDFGDAVESYLVADIAVALSYLIQAEGDPWRVADAFLQGYEGELPLTSAERAMVPGLVLGRSLQRLLINTALASANPLNASYTQKDLAATWAQFDNLIAHDVLELLA